MKNRKTLTVVILICIIAIIAGVLLYKPPGKTADAEVIQASSGLFSNEEMNEAVECIKNHFKKEFRDCELLKLKYVSDTENTSPQYAYLLKEYDIDQYIVYRMTFKVGKRYNPSYESNSTEEINIVLGRKANGTWKYLTGGRP